MVPLINAGSRLCLSRNCIRAFSTKPSLKLPQPLSQDQITAKLSCLEGRVLRLEESNSKSKQALEMDKSKFETPKYFDRICAVIIGATIGLVCASKK